MSGGHMHSMLCALYGVEAGPIRRGLVAISPVSQRVTRGTHGRVVARNVTLHAGLESCGCIRIVSLTPKLRLHPLIEASYWKTNVGQKHVQSIQVSKEFLAGPEQWGPSFVASGGAYITLTPESKTP